MAIWSGFGLYLVFLSLEQRNLKRRIESMENNEDEL